MRATRKREQTPAYKLPASIPTRGRHREQNYLAKGHSPPLRATCMLLASPRQSSSRWDRARTKQLQIRLTGGRSRREETPRRAGPAGRSPEKFCRRCCYCRKAGQQGPSTRPALRPPDSQETYPKPKSLPDTSPMRPTTSRGLQDSDPDQQRLILKEKLMTWDL